MKPIIPLQTLPDSTRAYAETVAHLTGPDAWDSLKKNDRDAYDALIAQLQKHHRGICGYCEIGLVAPRRKPKQHQRDIPDREVEHFHPKSREEDGRRWVFEPGNLFLTCRNTSNSHLDDPHRVDPPSSCGTFKKDRNPDDIDEAKRPLRPSDLPHRQRVFTVDQENGALSAWDCGCAIAGLAKARVEATIAFLNLDCRRLRRARAIMLSTLDDEFSSYLQQYPDDDSLARRTMAEDLLLCRDGGDLPEFFTTLREYLQPEAEDVLAENLEGWLMPVG